MRRILIPIKRFRILELLITRRLEPSPDLFGRLVFRDAGRALSRTSTSARSTDDAMAGACPASRWWQFHVGRTASAVGPSRQPYQRRSGGDRWANLSWRRPQSVGQVSGTRRAQNRDQSLVQLGQFGGSSPVFERIS